jgi:hypothetical protein
MIFKESWKRKKMRSAWKDEDLSKAIRKMSKAPMENVVFDRVWFKIEQHLSPADRVRGHSFVWRPWLHPVRWVMAACLCLALASGLHYRSLVDQADLAVFIESISNPAEEVTADDEDIQASVLLTDTSSFSSVDSFLPENEDWSQPLLGDEAEIQ